jgi:hypothetical protein
MDPVHTRDLPVYPSFQEAFHLPASVRAYSLPSVHTDLVLDHYQSFHLPVHVHPASVLVAAELVASSVEGILHLLRADRAAASVPVVPGTSVSMLQPEASLLQEFHHDLPTSQVHPDYIPVRLE